ncbi:unnamed protein product, partial [marine sediment metagenome]
PYDADTDETISVPQIRLMSIIQIHAYILKNLGEKSVGGNLLEIFNRDRLQQGLIDTLGL